jgi:hypothetical protein
LDSRLPQLPEWCLAGVDPEVDRVGAAGAQIDRWPLLRQPRSVGGDQHVGAERFAVLRAQVAQTTGPGLLTHLDEPFGVEAEFAAFLQHGAERREIYGVLALVVGGAAPPIAPLGFDEFPRRDARLPASFESTDHVAMAIAEHGGARGILDPLGEQERGPRFRVSEDAASKAPGFQRRLHLSLDVIP